MGTPAEGRFSRGLPCLESSLRSSRNFHKSGGQRGLFGEDAAQVMIKT